MSGRRVARRIASMARAEKDRFAGVSDLTLATKVFDWSFQFFLLPCEGAGGRRRDSHGRGTTGVAVWRGRGGKRRIAWRGALPPTPVAISSFVTDEVQSKVEQ
jgi:hypothetical protein